MVSRHIGELGVAEKPSGWAVRLAPAARLDSGAPNFGAGIIRAKIEQAGHRALGSAKLDMAAADGRAGPFMTPPPKYGPTTLPSRL